MNQSVKSTYYSRKLRKALTDAERKVWNVIRGRQLDNIKFRRQFPIGKFIVDFVSVENKLIIEVDGGQHNNEKSILYDKERTRYLEQHGYTVLRFWNNDVLSNIDGVIEKVRSSNGPHPNLHATLVKQAGSFQSAPKGEGTSTTFQL